MAAEADNGKEEKEQKKEAKVHRPEVRKKEKKPLAPELKTVPAPALPAALKPFACAHVKKWENNKGCGLCTFVNVSGSKDTFQKPQAVKAQVKASVPEVKSAPAPAPLGIIFPGFDAYCLVTGICLHGYSKANWAKGKGCRVCCSNRKFKHNLAADDEVVGKKAKQPKEKKVRVKLAKFPPGLEPWFNLTTAERNKLDEKGIRARVALIEQYRVKLDKSLEECASKEEERFIGIIEKLVDKINRELDVLMASLRKLKQAAKKKAKEERARAVLADPQLVLAS